MATILLIDDQESIRLIFKAVLERAGYRVLTAEHGKDGLRFLEQERVDLVLLDIVMPEMDGFELIPRLRKNRPSSKIIAMTGDSNYLNMAKHLGVNDALQKPFSVQQLLTAVSSHLN